MIDFTSLMIAIACGTFGAIGILWLSSKAPLRLLEGTIILIAIVFFGSLFFN